MSRAIVSREVVLEAIVVMTAVSRSKVSGMWCRVLSSWLLLC